MKSNSRNAKLFAGWLCSLALLVVCGATAWAQTGGSTAHLTDAVALKDNLLISGVNKYDDPADGSSQVSYIIWNGAQSQAFTDCSNFLTLLIKHTYPWMDDNYYKGWFSFTGSNTVTKPNAAKYHDAIEGGHGFTQIFAENQITPGDVVAIKYINEATSGHVMLVQAAPVFYRADAYGLAYKVGVIDSTRSYHGSSANSGDSRVGTNGGLGGGVGFGYILVYYSDLGSNVPGDVVGYRWSVGSSEHFTQAQRHLVIGRLQ